MKKITKNIHHSVYIDENVLIGKNTKIWHFSHISQNVKIGKNCSLGQNIFVGKNVAIKDNVKIQNNVSIFEGVELNNEVFCGPSVVFTNVLNPRSFINQKKKFNKTIVKNGVTIGGNSTIICGITLGKYSFIGAGSVVTKNVKPFSLNYGNPSIQKGWVNRNGKKIKMPLIGDAEYECKETKKLYILKNNNLYEKNI